MKMRARFVYIVMLMLCFLHVGNAVAGTNVVRGFDYSNYNPYRDSEIRWTTVESRDGGSFKLNFSQAAGTSQISSSTYSSIASVGQHLQVNGTGSFMQMHSSIADAYKWTEEDMAQDRAIMYAKNRPGTNPTGQFPPVGDALLPLLLMAMGYFFFHRRRNQADQKD